MAATKPTVNDRSGSGPQPWLDRPADERTVLELHAAGLIDTAARDEALAMLAPARHPREYRNHPELRDPWPRSAAKSIVAAIKENSRNPARRSRHTESGLSRLLDNVVWASNAARRLALTATPEELDISQWSQTLGRLYGRLDDEYSRTQGGFARLMYGQQIGRVDRVASHWSNQLNQAIANGSAPDALPRIEVRPVIFSGTYDEHNWQVLRTRWDDLRAQLHGIVIPPSVCVDDESKALIDEISAAAPNFSPTARYSAPASTP